MTPDKDNPARAVEAGRGGIRRRPPGGGGEQDDAFGPFRISYAALGGAPDLIARQITASAIR
jgi:hypothetical protein